MLDRNPNATFRELAETEDFVEYNDNILNVNITGIISVFRNILSFEVENLMDVRRYFRIAPGIYNGFGKYIKLNQI